MKKLVLRVNANNRPKDAKTSIKMQCAVSLLSDINLRIVVITALFVSGFLFAQTLEEVLIEVCNNIMDMILPLALLLVTIAAVSYALGGIMTAEMRARMHVWAQSLLIGAIIGVIIYIIMPVILGALIKAGGVDVSSVCAEISGLTGTCADRIKEAIC